MEDLGANRNNIKVEKERLLKLQQFDGMEATVQREMQEKHRKSTSKNSVDRDRLLRIMTQPHVENTYFLNLALCYHVPDVDH